ncbi:MAG: hypothetical protein KAH38_00675, partial [Candidatus Hydrogenedentes bacterium]|nr:hypothetical protein [Candidatus Hydrogenedentota bacterium]
MMNLRYSRYYGMMTMLLLVVFFCMFADGASLKMPSIFSDHAVLQQNAVVPVWGWGSTGAEVTVSIAGQVKAGRIGDGGKWRVDLEAMTAGGPYELVIESDGEAIVLSDLLIGEVWLGSGQSNMQWTIKNTEEYEEELKQCENDSIRFAMIYREHSAEEIDEFSNLTPWASCTAETLGGCYDGAGFSAVSYYFAKYLQEELGVPVGIINTSWGGTRIEPWTPPEGFEQVSSLADIAATVRMNTPDSTEYQSVLRDTIAEAEAWLPAA